MDITGFGTQVAQRGWGTSSVRVFHDGEFATVVKGRGCGSLAAASQEGELICGDDYVELTAAETDWLATIADKLAAEGKY